MAQRLKGHLEISKCYRKISTCTNCPKVNHE